MADRPFTVTFPSDLHQLADGSPLYGYLHPATRQVVVVGAEEVRAHQPSALQLGWLEPAPTAADQVAGSSGTPGLRARRNGDGLLFQLDGTPCLARTYNLHQDLFSRQLGLLETDRMGDCGVIVSGCGSVGSQAALDLARSGVGRFLLIDPDLLAIENLCRHQCGLADVGRHKVSAVAERIHQINPRAEVSIHPTALEQLDPAVVAAFATGQALMLACADSRRADHYAARLAATLALPFLAIGLWERAFAGEIFYSHPDAEMPCYGCALQGLSDTLTAPERSRRRFYTTEEDVERLSFEPGIAIDIGMVTLIGLKLAIDLLNLHNPRHVPRLLGHLSQYTLVCNSNDPRLGGERAEIFSHPLQVTTSIQVDYGEGCPPCRWTR